MADSASAVPSNPGSFASLLASFTGIGRGNDSWDDAALADDVVNLSYEQALRSVRGFRPEAVQDSTPVNKPTASSPQSKAGKQRKAASVTIRLSEAEQAQLRERAAEAKLTLSAYLRSCIFEAESLRAQVKEALTQMRAGALADKAPTAVEEPSSSLFKTWARWRRRPRLRKA